MSDQYAVIGNPIGHTKSPLIHRLFAEETGQDIAYVAMEAPVEPDGAFADTVSTFIAAGGKGMNVTAPFKLKAFAMADERSERATLAGAVNAMKFENGRVIAENFDGVGLVRDIEVNLHQPMAGKRVLILGAGGAVRGALLPFIGARPAELVIVNRHPDKAQALVEQAGAGSAARVQLRGPRIDGALRPCRQRDFGKPHRTTAAGSAQRIQRERQRLRARLRQGLDAVPAARAQRRCAGHRGWRRDAGRAGGRSVRMVARRSTADACADRSAHRSARAA